MKKIALTILACAAICACDKEASVTKDVSQQPFEGGVAYLTVNIKDVNTSTRANSGGFAYGTGVEQTVSNAHFYFYDDNGNYMAQGSLGSVSGTASEAEPAANIEWGSNTVVAVWGLTGDDGFPTKMVTVLNEPANFSGAHKSLEEMTAALSEATNGWNSGSATSPSFVMSTSVYWGTNGVVNYTALTDDDFSLEPINLDTDYPSGGVEVYVERLAAKVGVTLSATMYGDAGLSTTLDSQTIDEVTYYDVRGIVGSGLESDLDGDLYLGVLGWDLNGTSRDSYMLKDISSNWNLTFTWNDATEHRSYWAESPNYGVEVEYPTTSDGNTDADEDSNPLNGYLRYTSLASPIAFNSYGYCAENTNTAGETGILGDALSNGITNVLVKAQAGTIADGAFTPVDLVEFHGGYYTAEDFCQTVVDDVVEYDFTVLVDEVIAALKADYPDLSTYLDDLNDCVIKDNVWVIPAVPYHLPNGWNVDGNLEPQKFDGSLLSLYNIGDGNVDLFFNGAQPYWGYCEFTYDSTSGSSTRGDITSYEPHFTAINDGIMDNYPESAIVYGGADLDDYEFMFHIDEEGLGSLELMGLIAAGVVFQINGDYYMILGNNFSFTTEGTGDPNFSGGHTYTLRNYLLRAITVEADGIDSEFGSHYPNFYKEGLMYYAIPVEHLGSTTGDSIVEGQYGIVRNHWYDITINYIASLGYGIADEDEVIVPQPVVDYYYLGADVNILSWAMITQTSGLGPRN